MELLLSASSLQPGTLNIQAAGLKPGQLKPFKTITIFGLLVAIIVLMKPTSIL